MIDFSLYPNLNGNLGENKVAIPDGVIVKWPDGDALVGNFIYKNGKLSGFVDTKALIANDNKTTTIPYDYFEAEMENVREDSVTFNLSDRCKYFTLKLMPKYKGCKTLSDVKNIDENYVENDIIDGAWTKELEDLVNVGTQKVEEGMFYNCGSLITFDKDLKSLTNGRYMFHSCTNLISFDGNLPSLTTALDMFHTCTKLTSFETDLSSLENGWGVFADCSNLTTFNSNLSSVIDGTYMFHNCENLSLFKCGDLSSLSRGGYMFENCSSLTDFDYDMKSLTNGGAMFNRCTNLSSYTSDLSSLTNGGNMFYNCKSLTTFEISDLNSLTNGNGMFYNCKFSSFNSDLKSLTDGRYMFNACTNLTSYKGDLRSLEKGEGIFINCKLDTQSLKNIAETINTVTESNIIHIGIGNTTPSEEENTYLTQIHDKGWQVYVNGAGDSNIFNPTSLIPIDGEQNLNPIPFWAKPVPSTQEEANYIDENGNYFNILGGQFIYVNDPESYGMFMNEEDAAAQMRLTKIVKEEMSL